MEISVKKLPYSFAKMHGILIGETKIEGTFIYHLKETPLQVRAEVSRLLQGPLLFKAINEQEFQHHLAQAYQDKSSILDAAEGMQDEIDLSLLASQVPNSEDLLADQNDAPIIRLLNALFTQAIKHKASDIHIETYEDKVFVRIRIDGILQQVLEIGRAVAPRVISRVKVMAKLDIAEKRKPQDGRISLRIGGHQIDVRVSTLPSNHGERVVLRILDKQAAQLDLNLLGMEPSILKSVRQMISQPHGIILVTGPTGSGKTTSLYAMLTELNEVSRNILTIEDPIEYDLGGIGQTQVNPKIDLTFAKGLRAILRQDPDVVMIGEIRDKETADIAVQASLTGHLLLSTLHTNTALGALPRLRDMGIESFLLSSSLIGLIAQRLVRRLCPQCKIPQALEESEIALLGIEQQGQFFAAKGCEACNHSGYRGRTGIYEVIPIDEHLQGMIHRQESQQEIEQYLRPGIPSIRDDGIQLALRGETSLAEILRVTVA